MTHILYLYSAVASTWNMTNCSPTDDIHDYMISMEKGTYATAN
jgi:hypothetical protein